MLDNVVVVTTWVGVLRHRGWKDHKLDRVGSVRQLGESAWMRKLPIFAIIAKLVNLIEHSRGHVEPLLHHDVCKLLNSSGRCIQVTTGQI